MMNKTKIITIIIGIIILNIFLINAVDYPKITPYVNDYANILTPQEEAQLNAYSKSIEEQTTYEIVILTVEDTQGEGRTMFANRVGEENGVGKKDESNGLIVMWSLENEKGGGIAVGRGAESIFNDAKVGRIGRDSRHYFDDEQYYDGFVSIIDDISKEINASANGNILVGGEVEVTPGMIISLIIFIIVIIVLWIMFPDFFLFALILHMLMPRRGGSGVSLGGGSFGGGGGDF